MRVIDLFGGVGGLSLGFEKVGFEIMANVDSWDDAVATFNFNHKSKVGYLMDVGEFNKKILPDVIDKGEISGVIGGPPCQGYSSARLSDKSEKIDGINEERNKLYLDFFDAVKACSPKFFLIENVSGMVTMDNGSFVKDIRKRFGKIGYKVTNKILDAADYGVPQHRKRVFFVGLLGDREFIFPSGSDKRISCHDALSDLPSLSDGAIDTYACNPKSEYQINIRGKSKQVLNHEPTNHSQATIDIINLVPDGGNIKSLPDKYWNVRKFNKAFQRMNSKKPSLTIDTGHRNYFHYFENRIPTVRESARIQSFPDNFVFLGSKTSQYRQVGNAVPPLVGLALAQAILNQISKD